MISPKPVASAGYTEALSDILTYLNGKGEAVSILPLIQHLQALAKRNAE